MSEAWPAATAAPLSISTVRSGPGSARVELAGEIDMSTAPRLRAALRAAIAAATPRTEVRVDLRGVTFIDAIGVGVLVACSQTARRSGVGFVVEHPEGIVLRILEVLNLADELGVIRVQPVSPAPPAS